MNQILLTDNYNNRDKKNDNNKNYNRNNSKDIKKIIIFFVINNIMHLYALFCLLFTSGTKNGQK